MRVAALGCAALLLAGAPARPAEQAPATEQRSSAEQAMVLIVSVASPVRHLDVIEVRKLFLGLTVISNDRPLHALSNRSDERLWQAFLQNVIAMPERSYEKRLRSTALQPGAHRPEIFTVTQKLLAAVAADPSAVSVAWAADVADDRRIRVLRVLWRD